jgi:hypothetical protein
MAVSEKAFETKLNTYLSKILSLELGIHSTSETRRGKGRPDILIFIGGLKIIIEGSYSRQDAENDVRVKIEKGFADLGIELYYKEKIPDAIDAEVENRLRNSRFDVRIFKSKDIINTLDYHLHGNRLLSLPISGWFEAGIVDLTSYVSKRISELLTEEESLTKATQEIEMRSDDFVNRLKSVDTTKKISENLYNVFYRLNGLHFGDYKQIAELIYANSFLTLLLSIAFYQSVQPHLSLEDLSILTSRFGKKEGLRKAFQLIQEIDYRPIYDIATQVVGSLTDNLFEDAINLGNKLGSNQTLLKRDFAGRIYHKVVGDWSLRKGFGTFFTTIPASYLLSYLAIFSKYNRINDPETIKICDFTL